jgi:hypothetical protein
LLKDHRVRPKFVRLVTDAGISSAPEGLRAITQEEQRMKDLAKMIVTGVSTVALAGGIGAGLAYAHTPSDEPTTSPSAAATSSPAETPDAKPNRKRHNARYWEGDNADRKPKVGRQLRFVARALHGEVTLAGEEHRVIVFQRGHVQKVSKTSVTVKSNDGFVETYALSDDTKVRQNREEAKPSDIDTSDRVLVVALKDDSNLTARRVIVRD